MGVQIAEILPKNQITMDDLNGKVIAVDSFNWIYQFLSSIRQPDGTPLQDSSGRITSHLSGLFYRTARLLENGIKPVYVFDGKPPDLKMTEVERRREIKKEAKAKLEEALEIGDMEEARKQAMRTSELTAEMIAESKELLISMGIPVVQAAGEGEAQCSAMCQNGDVYAVASQDSDSLLFGTPRMIRNLNITGKRMIRGREIIIYPEIIELQEVLRSLEITHEQLIILGILCGTDYNSGGIKGIGPKKALKLIKEQKTFDKIFESVEWEFRASPREIFELFQHGEYEKQNLVFEKPDAERLRSILCDEHGFSRDRIDPTIEKIVEKSSQKSLSSFFR